MSRRTNISAFGIIRATLLLPALLLLFGTAASAGTVQETLSGGMFSVPVKSMRELRFRTVVPQRFDYSCGAAAVATLLTYSYDQPTPEAAPFIQMIKQGDQAKIQRLGFSLLDMKNYLQSRGYHVSGFRMSLKQLQQIAVPGIALVVINGYKHFVVIRNVDDTHVLLADPAMGMHVMERSRFKKIWDNVLLVIRDKTDLARQHFLADVVTKFRPAGPLGPPLHQMDNGLSVYTQGLFVRYMF